VALDHRRFRVLGIFIVGLPDVSATAARRRFSKKRQLAICPDDRHPGVWKLRNAAEHISAVKVEHAFAVAELLDIVAAKRAQHAQHHVRERRAILRPQMDSPIERTAGATGDEKRHPLVIVLIRVAHRRPVEEQGVVEDRGTVLVRDLPQSFEKVRNQADVVGVDLREVEDLAEVYEGSISLLESPLGGLRARLQLPSAG